ncbi:Putative ribonuclease H protein At1g65750 [Linum perenne]
MRGVVGGGSVRSRAADGVPRQLNLSYMCFGIVVLLRAPGGKLEGSVDDAKVIAAMCLGWETKVSWQMGQQGWTVVNSDGSVLGARGKAAAGGILRDCEGKCIQAYAINLGVCSITRDEIRGALEGIRHINQSIEHQHALEVLEFRDWELRLKHVYREANQAADFLANMGHSLPRGCHSIPISNCNLAYYVRYDCLEISEPRMVN